MPALARYGKLRVALSAARERSALRIPTDARKAAYVDLTQRVHDRTLREIILALELAGYQVYFRGRLSPRNPSALRMAQTIRDWHPSTTLVWSDPRAEVPLAVTDSPARLAPAGKRVLVRYDYYSHRSYQPPDFAMPFPMHPQLYCQYGEYRQLPRYRQAERTVRILFAGNYGRSGYDTPVLAEKFGKVNRYAIVEVLRAHPNTVLARSSRELESAFDGSRRTRFVLVDCESMRIDQREWMGYLSRSDFFLCPPGIVRPLSHNATEAMAVGTVPLISYPEWFFPNLGDGENCMAFDTLESLSRALDALREMAPCRIEQMRHGAVTYYDEHLDLAGFICRLANHPAPTCTLHTWD